MSNGFYAKGKEAIISGGVDFVNDDIRAVMVDTALYSVNLATHEFLSDIAVGARVDSSTTSINNKSVDGGVLKLKSNHQITNVPNTTVEAIVIYRHTGTDATAKLLLWFDTAPGLPFNPKDDGTGDVRLFFDPAGVFGL